MGLVIPQRRNFATHGPILVVGLCRITGRPESYARSAVVVLARLEENTHASRPGIGPRLIGPGPGATVTMGGLDAKRRDRQAL
jgi:hypothetical protein